MPTRKSKPKNCALAFDDDFGLLLLHEQDFITLFSKVDEAAARRFFAALVAATTPKRRRRTRPECPGCGRSDC